MSTAAFRIDHTPLILRPASPLPTLADLLAIAMDRTQSDFLGDIDFSATALGIAMYCGEQSVMIAELWEDDNGSLVPLDMIRELTDRLHTEAWERIYAEWAERDAEDAHDP